MSASTECSKLSSAPSEAWAGDGRSVRQEIQGGDDFETIVSPQIDGFGGFQVDGDPVVAAVVREGEAAVEPLIACVEQDRRLLRSVPGRGDVVSADFYLVGVHEAAFIALQEIFKTQSFGPNAKFPLRGDYGPADPERCALAAAEIRAFWNKTRGLNEAESWYAALADDGATEDQWLEAAAKITASTLRTHPATDRGTETLGLRGLDVWGPPAGEAIREGKQPSVAALLADRSDRLTARDLNGTIRLHRMNDACALALCLARWNREAALPVLARRIEECRALTRDQFYGFHAVEHFGGTLPTMVMVGVEAGAPGWLGEYAGWVRDVPAGRTMFLRDPWIILGPVARYPRDPAMRELAAEVFADGSPWLARGGRRGWNEHYSSPFVALSAFREHLKRKLGDQSLCGTARFDAKGPSITVNFESGRIPTTQRYTTQRYTTQRYAAPVDLNDPGYQAPFAVGSMMQPVPMPADPDNPRHQEPFAVRIADFVAWRISFVEGAPAFQLYWTQAERDAATARIVGFLDAHGNAYGERSLLNPPAYFAPRSFRFLPSARFYIPKLDRPATKNDVGEGRPSSHSTQGVSRSGRWRCRSFRSRLVGKCRRRMVTRRVRRSSWRDTSGRRRRSTSTGGYGATTSSSAGTTSSGSPPSMWNSWTTRRTAANRRIVVVGREHFGPRRVVGRCTMDGRFPNGLPFNGERPAIRQIRTPHSMRPNPFVIALLVVLSLGISQFAMADSPPVAPVTDVVETYFGTQVADPYRYMEKFQDPAVQAWVRGQADYADRTLGALPGRAALRKRIAELDAGAPYTLYAITRRPSGDLFYLKQLAGENVAKIYTRDGKTSAERLLVDPETFPKKDPKDHFTLSFYRVSPDGSKLLYGFAASGSEETTLRVFDLEMGRDLPDSIDRMEAEYAYPTWLPDSKSFTYSRRRKLPADVPATEGYKFTAAFRHIVGEDPDNDPMILGARAAGKPAPGSPPFGEMDFPAVIVTSDSKWAVGQVKHGDETDISIYAAPLDALGSAEIKWTKVCDRADQVTDFAVHGDDIYLLTAADAPRYRVVRTGVAAPDFVRAAVVVPPGEYVIDSVAAASDALYVGVLEGVPHKLLRVAYEKNAKPQSIPLPDGEPSAFMASVQPDLSGLLLETQAWTHEGKIYRYDAATGRVTDAQLSPHGKFDAPEGITSTEVLVRSHDGALVPLSIIHRSDLKLDGENPTQLTGYGAYGHTMPMNYDPTNLAWLERGGVIAYAHVRGGGAFGKPWHHGGRKATKPNTWKDFIACAGYLVSKGYTRPAKLAGKGGSAGGILIGRAITERPDLFAAANIAVGCTDMIRFETTTNGPPNVPEFGTVTKEDEFRGLLAMSTIHQIRDGEKYPAVILTHGINDPRVEPWESAKATARFQAATGSGKPVLFRVDYHSGHGIGSTRQQRQEEKADLWSFFLWQFGDKAFQP